MQIFKAYRAIASILLAGACAAGLPAAAQEHSASPFMRGGEVADAPAGFLDMCAREINLCQAEVGQAELIGTLEVVAAQIPYPVDKRLRRAELHMIAAVNLSVNRRIRQVNDDQAYGVIDRWNRASTVGDCEDIALEKQAELVSAGLSPRRLRLAVAYDRNNGLHAVLIVTTPMGDLVLDSLTQRIVTWNRTRYRWLRIQSAANNSVWSMVA